MSCGERWNGRCYCGDWRERGLGLMVDYGLPSGVDRMVGVQQPGTYTDAGSGPNQIARARDHSRSPQ